MAERRGTTSLLGKGWLGWVLSREGSCRGAELARGWPVNEPWVGPWVDRHWKQHLNSARRLASEGCCRGPRLPGRGRMIGVGPWAAQQRRAFAQHST